jgi:hypothetical protein
MAYKCGSEEPILECVPVSISAYYYYYYYYYYYASVIGLLAVDAAHL